MIQYFSPGAIIDERYELNKSLGVGASGEVWLARDQQIPRNVALKIMNGGLTVSDKHVERFHREIHSLNELGNTHPNIPQLYGANVLTARPYLVMEYIAGDSLINLMNTGKLYKLSFEKRLLTIISQLSDALTFAHDHNIIHRDIKPENVKIIGEADKTYLLDFSVAVLNTESTRRGIGTPRYIAPELQTSKYADLFSLAILIYEILFRIHPVFKPDDNIRQPLKAQKLMLARLQAGDWIKPTELDASNHDFPAGLELEKLDAIFARALSPEPKQRPDNALALTRGLEEALKDNSSTEIVLSTLSSGRHQIDTVSKEIGAVFDATTETIIEPEDEESVEKEPATNKIPTIVSDESQLKTQQQSTQNDKAPDTGATISIQLAFMLGAGLWLAGIMIGIILF